MARTPLRATLLLAACAALAACVYRPNIQQGNLLEVEDVDQVTAGMTRSQVRYLLGTPMVSDPFTPERWDYVYTLKRGRQRGIDRTHFVVYFDGDTVSRVEKLDLPDDGPGQKGKKKADPTREPPPAPSVKQAQPDAPRPGGG